MLLIRKPVVFKAKMMPKQSRFLAWPGTIRSELSTNTNIISTWFPTVVKLNRVRCFSDKQRTAS
jgi:hypothetical protein